MNDMLTTLRATKAHLDAIAKNHSGEVRIQIEDRAFQVNNWIFTVERRGPVMSQDREDNIRQSCEEWLRWR